MSTNSQQCPRTVFPVLPLPHMSATKCALFRSPYFFPSSKRNPRALARFTCSPICGSLTRNSPSSVKCASVTSAKASLRPERLGSRRRPRAKHRDERGDALFRVRLRERSSNGVVEAPGEELIAVEGKHPIRAERPRVRDCGVAHGVLRLREEHSVDVVLEAVHGGEWRIDEEEFGAAGSEFGDERGAFSGVDDAIDDPKRGHVGWGGVLVRERVRGVASHLAVSLQRPHVVTEYAVHGEGRTGRRLRRRGRDGRNSVARAILAEPTTPRGASPAPGVGRGGDTGASPARVSIDIARPVSMRRVMPARLGVVDPPGPARAVVCTAAPDGTNRRRAMRNVCRTLRERASEEWLKCRALRDTLTPGFTDRIPHLGVNSGRPIGRPSD